MGARPMRITVVDDHRLFADAIAAALEDEGFIVGQIDLSDGQATLASVLGSTLRSAARMVLLEPSLGRVGNGLRLIRPLTASGTAVVVLTGSSDRAVRGEALLQGARAALLKTCALADVVATAGSVREDRPLVADGERAALIRAALREREDVRELRARIERLTRRETEVLGALMQGAQVGDIARTAVVAEVTVRSQVKRILAKLEVTSQVAAVAAAYRAGWRPPVSESPVSAEAG